MAGNVHTETAGFSERETGINALLAEEVEPRLIDEESIPLDVELNQFEQRVYDALRPKFERVGFDVVVKGSTHKKHFPEHDYSWITKELRRAGINAPIIKQKTPSNFKYLIVEVSPSDGLRNDDHSFDHSYHLKSGFHSRLNKFMTGGAVPLDDASRIPGYKNDGVYKYRFKVGPEREAHVEIRYTN
ncbi:hypothetical protein HN695_05510 [Candidatus Woesearchaeota archaeon]|jgi:hypothetical protein|nr:hypothetical protein [Candidatus Woesearchaeota archaeon]MBT5272195.1 hypothetical protein [Candidatus Woesearchaeota archaeon]MBT6041539.1 hypothetical protein [Candidatus Woesearchaeota archaeon]MBT6336901.1 hypothetical protein [Candidatus Woesearchaeota archaeon]MBT7927771.1 hypothetical protein [Candidatus Woesearchaeota archaeon]